MILFLSYLVVFFILFCIGSFSLSFISETWEIGQPLVERDEFLPLLVFSLIWPMALPVVIFGFCIYLIGIVMGGIGNYFLKLGDNLIKEIKDRKKEKERKLYIVKRQYQVMTSLLRKNLNYNVDEHNEDNAAHIIVNEWNKSFGKGFEKDFGMGLGITHEEMKSLCKEMHTVIYSDS
ncbi:MAG: hypothetical protein AABY22_31280 [Nanoarchaeota archaeon]